MHPAIVGSHTVRSVGDVSGVHSQTMIELSLEKLCERREELVAQGEGGTVRGGKELTLTTCPLLSHPKLGLPPSLGSTKTTRIPK